MHALRPLSKDAIPAALAKAERYRLLNEPAGAESICLDILAVDPTHQAALVMTLLAVTDQFRDEGVGGHVARAQAILPRLESPYDRAYYAGLIAERRARAHLAHGGAHAEVVAREWLREALAAYKQALDLRAAGNDDAVLRWNACVRTLDRMPAPAPEPDVPAIQSE